jgi:hypothetical protein
MLADDGFDTLVGKAVLDGSRVRDDDSRDLDVVYTPVDVDGRTARSKAS